MCLVIMLNALIALANYNFTYKLKFKDVGKIHC